MGLFQNLFGSKQKSLGIQELSRMFSTGVWDNRAMLDQYEKSLYVFACINKIAQKIAAIDLKLFEITNSKGEVKEYPSHPILDLLYKPNPFQTRSEFWKIAMINKKLTGEAFWWKVRNSGGKVVELWNLRPDMMTIYGDQNNFISKYQLSKLDGTIVDFEPRDIIHFKDPNPLNVYRGMSPLLPAQSRILTEQYSTEFQRDFFLNNARPDALLMSPDMLAPEQKDDLRAAWSTKHKGRGKNSNIGLLEGGMEYQQISVSQREMDYIESLKFTRDDILVAFGIPKSVMTTDDVNLANAESGMYIFLSETIKPEMVTLAEVINEMLVIPEFGERLYVDFQDPTPEDRDMKLKEYTAGYDKWITPNEIRAGLNLEPMDGGDLLTRPINAVPINAPAVVPTASPQKIFKGREQLRVKMQMIEGMADDVIKSLKTTKKSKKKTKESLLKDANLRNSYEIFVNKKIGKRAEKFKTEVLKEIDRQQQRVLQSVENKALVEKASAGDLLANFDKKKENQILSKLALPFMVDAATESGQDALDLVGVGEHFDYTQQLQNKLLERAKFFAGSVNDTTLEKLSKTLAEGINAGEGIAQLTDRVKAVYSEFSDYRAELIARTESTAVNNEGFLEAYKQSSVVNSQEWVATMDFRTRPEHAAMNGEIVEVGKEFSNGLLYPQEPNCRCVLAPSI